MIEVVGVLVAAADREHAGAEHIEAKLSAKPRTPIRGQATAIEGSCDWQNRIIGRGVRG
jgi:hypothetical protein